MANVGSVSAVPWISAAPKPKNTSNANPRICFLTENHRSSKEISFSRFFTHLSSQKGMWGPLQLPLRASSSFSVDSLENVEEPATKVRFQRSLSLPGCSTPLSLLGTGYREKVFAIIGVKVYSAGLYLSESAFSTLHAWKGRSAEDLKQDSAFSDTIFRAPSEKTLHIVLVRDVDGKTFWDALNDAISPRIKSRIPVDEAALSTFSNIFLGRPLNKGTSIFLTWLDSTKMLVSVSSERTPLDIGTTVESNNVISALFNVFLGGDPVSPTLKESVANGLAAALK